MDTATSDSGNKDTARPRVWRQLRNIDIASFVLAGVGLGVALFPDAPLLLKGPVAVLVFVLWFTSVVGLARDKVELEQRIQGLESKTYGIRTEELRGQLKTRQSNLEAAEASLTAAYKDLAGLSGYTKSYPRVVAAQSKVDRAKADYDSARNMRDTADQTLQEHIDRGPAGPDREDVVKSNGVGKR